MRMTRAETKERNRRALLEAARRVVTRDGHGARLEEIAEQAGLTTGAVYSLFGSKNGLLTALVADHLGPHYDGIDQAVPASLDLLAAVEAFAHFYARTCANPEALRHLSFETSLQDMALRDPELKARLATSIQAHEERLAELFTGRPHQGSTVSARQARHLARALRALLSGLGQRAVLGLTEQAPERYFADTARALVAPEVLGPA
ncbi:transcriptional regulator BetI [Streptomyces chartreusis NRRL 3882]|uniref:Transcriptional regulator BetI n=2 Tax=Streptomyces TaxID=1883 RepID=A0A2N9B002_STRCX|nr:transcriptional regulator BetI [Streptomyces chartreusis NRRL 3882]